MGLLKSLFGKPKKSKKSKQTRAVTWVVQAPAAPVERYRLINAYHQPLPNLPKPKPGQEEIVLSGNKEQRIFNCYLDPFKGTKKGQRFKLEVIPQDVEFFHDTGESFLRSDEDSSSVVTYQGIPVGTIHFPILKDLARRGYKVYVDAYHGGMDKIYKDIPHICYSSPENSEMYNWGPAMELFGEYIAPNRLDEDLLRINVSENSWSYPEEIAGDSVENFCYEYVVPEKKSLKPRIEIRYKGCLLRKFYESDPDYDFLSRKLKQKLCKAAFKREYSKSENAKYYWRVCLLFGDE